MKKALDIDITDVNVLDALTDKPKIFLLLCDALNYENIKDQDTRAQVKAICYLGTKLICEDPTSMFVARTEQNMGVIASLYKEIITQSERHQTQFERAANFLLTVKERMAQQHQKIEEQ